MKNSSNVCFSELNPDHRTHQTQRLGLDFDDRGANSNGFSISVPFSDPPAPWSPIRRVDYLTTKEIDATKKVFSTFQILQCDPNSGRKTS